MSVPTRCEYQSELKELQVFPNILMEGYEPVSRTEL